MTTTVKNLFFTSITFRRTIRNQLNISCLVYD